MTADEHYQEFSEPVREYMETQAASPSNLMRVIQRLGLPIPPSPEEAHKAITQYLREYGEDEFLMKMGRLRAPTPATPSPDQAPVALKWKKKMSPGSKLTVETVGKRRRPPEADITPGAPNLPPETPSSSNVQEFAAEHQGQPVDPAQPSPVHNPAPPAKASGDKEWPGRIERPTPQKKLSNIPPVLKGIPEKAITPEALKVAREGGNPFGPPPLIDRRSGLDRRSGSDRRNDLEIVFRNQRYGKDRRNGEERRAVPPPYRDPSVPMHECIGNPELKRLGWMPRNADALKPKKKKPDEE